MTRFPLLSLALLLPLSACNPSAGDAADDAALEAMATATAPVVATSVSAVCDLLNSATSAEVEGMDRYASEEVRNELAAGGFGYNAPIAARDGSCVTEAGDAEVIFVIEDRGADGFYAATVSSEIVGDNALLARDAGTAPEAPAPVTPAPAPQSTRTVADVCNGLRPIFGMGDGMAWRELDVFATMEVLRELRGVEDRQAIISAEGNTCVVSADSFGDAELILTVAQGSEGLMATGFDYRAAGDAANY